MTEPDNIHFQKQPTFYFIGVTTSKSLITKVFPLWMEILGLREVQIQGMDLKIHDNPQAYRRAVVQIKNDPLSLGALVTTHKIDLYNAAKDLFEYLDPYAQTCGEISSISKSNGRLEGHAKDPISVGLSLEAFLTQGYFGKAKAEVLCFGAGGSGIALALHLVDKTEKGDRPDRFVFVNRSQWRLDHARKMVEGLKPDIQFEYIQNTDPEVNDRILENTPPCSLVINATGMGKDTPGSPITWNGKFPLGGVAWEFNYRGELDFLQQTLAQRDERQLLVEDGWIYFLNGWTQVIAQVLHVDLNQSLFETLARAAEFARK